MLRSLNLRTLNTSAWPSPRLEARTPCPKPLLLPSNHPTPTPPPQANSILTSHSAHGAAVWASVLSLEADWRVQAQRGGFVPARAAAAESVGSVPAAADRSLSWLRYIEQDCF